jgi:hypothetical protein
MKRGRLAESPSPRAIYLIEVFSPLSKPTKVSAAQIAERNSSRVTTLGWALQQNCQDIERLSLKSDAQPLLTEFPVAQVPPQTLRSPQLREFGLRKAFLARLDATESSITPILITTIRFRRLDANKLIQPQSIELP